MVHQKKMNHIPVGGSLPINVLVYTYFGGSLTDKVKPHTSVGCWIFKNLYTFDDKEAYFLKIYIKIKFKTGYHTLYIHQKFA